MYKRRFFSTICFLPLLFFVIIGCYAVFIFVCPTSGALYNTDRQHEITKRLDGLVSLQKQIEESLNPDDRTRKSYHPLEYTKNFNALEPRRFSQKKDRTTVSKLHEFNGTDEKLCCFTTSHI